MAKHNIDDILSELGMDQAAAKKAAGGANGSAGSDGPPSGSPLPNMPANQRLYGQTSAPAPGEAIVPVRKVPTTAVTATPSRIDHGSMAQNESHAGPSHVSVSTNEGHAVPPYSAGVTTTPGGATTWTAVPSWSVRFSSVKWPRMDEPALRTSPASMSAGAAASTRAPSRAKPPAMRRPRHPCSIGRARFAKRRLPRCAISSTIGELTSSTIGTRARRAARVDRTSATCFRRT